MYVLLQKCLANHQNAVKKQSLYVCIFFVFKLKGNKKQVHLRSKYTTLITS